MRDRRRRVVARNRQKFLRGPAPSKPLLVRNGGHACVTAVSARRQAASREEVGKIMEGAVCFAPETGRGKTPRFGSDLFPPGKNPAMAAAETNRADDAQTTTPPPIRVPAAAAPVRAPTCPLFPSARKVRFGKRGQRSAYAAPASSHTPRRTSSPTTRPALPPLRLWPTAKATKGLPDLPGVLLLSCGRRAPARFGGVRCCAGPLGELAVGPLAWSPGLPVRPCSGCSSCRGGGRAAQCAAWPLCPSSGCPSPPCPPVRGGDGEKPPLLLAKALMFC